MGGIFDAALVEYGPKSPKSPLFAPAALRGTRFGLESRAVIWDAKSGSFWSNYAVGLLVRVPVVTTARPQLPSNAIDYNPKRSSAEDSAEMN